MQANEIEPENGMTIDYDRERQMRVFRKREQLFLFRKRTR